MSAIRVSCIIPVHNGEAYITDALESIRAQTIGIFEIIVVDDGSSDDTVATVKAYDPGITCISQANAGAPAARNRGLAAARGDFIAFLDADDHWHPSKTERQLKAFARSRRLMVCFTMVTNYWQNATPEHIRASRKNDVGVPLAGYTTQSMLARRAVFDLVGPFDATLRHSSETEWVMRAQAEGVPVKLIRDALVHRRLHDNNMSQREARASQEEYLQLLKTSLDRKRAQPSVQAGG